MPAFLYSSTGIDYNPHRGSQFAFASDLFAHLAEPLVPTRTQNPIGPFANEFDSKLIEQVFSQLAGRSNACAASANPRCTYGP
jgi:hypothetical protein